MKSDNVESTAALALRSDEVAPQALAAAETTPAIAVEFSNVRGISLVARRATELKIAFENCSRLVHVGVETTMGKRLATTMEKEDKRTSAR